MLLSQIQDVLSRAETLNLRCFTIFIKNSTAILNVNSIVNLTDTTLTYQKVGFSDQTLNIADIASI